MLGKLQLETEEGLATPPKEHPFQRGAERIGARLAFEEDRRTEGRGASRGSLREGFLGKYSSASSHAAAECPREN